MGESGIATLSAAFVEGAKIVQTTAAAGCVAAISTTAAGTAAGITEAALLCNWAHIMYSSSKMWLGAHSQLSTVPIC